MAYILTLVVVVLLFAAAMAVLKGRGASSGQAEEMPYQRSKSFLSKAERSFYEVLRRTVGPEFVVFAKVRLADLLSIPRGTPNAQSWRNRIQSKHVDFILCRVETLEPALVIELDDSSHEREDRRERDTFLDRALAAAELPVLHVPAAGGYVQRELAEQIRNCLGGQAVLAV